MLLRLSTLALLSLTTVGSLPAQITGVIGGRSAKPATPLLVATPYVQRQADSAAAVEAGIGLRERMSSRSIVGRDWQVISRDKMNQALTEFGYPHDAILTPNGARELARGIGSTRWMVMPTLTRNGSGRYQLSARLIGTYNGNDMAGYVATATQEAGDDLEDLGKQVADRLKDPLRALGDAQGCTDNMFSDPAEAAKDAKKALDRVPNFGLAEFCLGQMELRKDSTSKLAEQHFDDALKTDPLSIKTYSELGVIFQVRNDTSAVIKTYQQILRLDPLNPQLRNTAFDLFRRYGSQDAAEQVADEGIANDPSNTDWYDLKWKACMAQSKFDCAVSELATMYQVDSTKADTTFFQRISLSARLAEDTAAVVRWGSKGAERYPDNITLLKDAAKAYALAGDADNALEVTRKLLTLNPGDYDQLKVTAAMLANAGQAEKLTEFLPLVKSSGDADLQDTFGGLLVNAANKAQVADDTTKQVELAQDALETGTTEPRITSAAGFLIGVPLYYKIAADVEDIRKSKSCPDVTAYAKLVKEAYPVFQLAQASEVAQIKSFADQVATFLSKEVDVVDALTKAACQ